MEEQITTSETIPMVKNETVKDDGRILIYYTFTDADGASAAEEADHV